ncbi:MMPL family transporter [Guyparkeria sp. GHLCS8-2]|uniref:MMPL family transporter n=1 Tax=Guyparkeria halopsychrophila TaxID=3139421 RepID=UPI0037C7B359
MSPRLNHALVLGLWLTVVLLAIYSITQTRFTADMSAFLPASPSPEQQLLVDQLQQGAVSRTFLVGIEGGTGEQRAEASRQLHANLVDDPSFAAIQNGDRAHHERARQFLFEHRYLLSPAIDPERFSVEGLTRAIGESISDLNSPLGDVTRELFPRDPTGEMLALLDRHDSSTGPAGPARCCGVWSSDDQSTMLLVAQASASGSDTDGLARAAQRIQASFDTIRHDIDPSLNLVLAGSPMFAIETRDRIKAEVTLLTTISVILVALVLLLAYRSLPVLLAGLLPVGSGVAVGIAAVGLGFDQVHGITIGFGTALMGEAIDYSIYYFVQSRQAGVNKAEPGHRPGHPGAGQRAWLRDYWPTVRLGLVTSLIGFAALLFSGFPGLMQIGLYAMTGLLTAALVTRYVLPILGPRLPRADIAGLGRWLERPVAGMRRLRPVAMLLGALAVIVLVFQQDGLWRDTLSGLAPINPTLEAADSRLREGLGEPSPRHLIVVKGEDREAALRGAERVAAILDQQVEDGLLAGYRAPTETLPSLATQRARQAALPAGKELAQRLDQALAGLPVSPDRLQGFVDDVVVQKNAAAIELADLEGTPLWLAVSGQLPSEQATGQTVAVITLQTDTVGPQALAGLREAIAPVESAVLIDLLTESNRLYARYLNTTLTVSLAGAAAIILLLLLVQASPRRTLRTLLPITLAVLLVVAGHALFGGQLTLLHLVGLLLVAAIGSNYALFFQPPGDGKVDGDGNGLDARTLASLTLATTTTVCAFGVLAFSSVPVLQAIGATVAPGALAAWLLAAIFADPSTRPVSAMKKQS